MFSNTTQNAEIRLAETYFSETYFCREEDTPLEKKNAACVVRHHIKTNTAWRAAGRCRVEPLEMEVHASPLLIF